MTQTREEQARERFELEAAEHEMTILHNEGLYRHLRFKRPHTFAYHYDLVTWPGHLVICGDTGDYHFARIADMFEFFCAYGEKPDRISPDYWAEKLKIGPSGDRRAVRQYSFDIYRARVEEWQAEQADEMDGDRALRLRRAIDEQLLQESDWGGEPSEEEAHARLRDFEFDGHAIYDPFDWDLTEWGLWYLWCCWAIVSGIRRFEAAKAL